MACDTVPQETRMAVQARGERLENLGLVVPTVIKIWMRAPSLTVQDWLAVNYARQFADSRTLGKLP